MNPKKLVINTQNNQMKLFITSFIYTQYILPYYLNTVLHTRNKSISF